VSGAADGLRPLRPGGVYALRVVLPVHVEHLGLRSSRRGASAMCEPRFERRLLHRSVVLGAVRRRCGAGYEPHSERRRVGRCSHGCGFGDVHDFRLPLRPGVHRRYRLRDRLVRRLLRRRMSLRWVRPQRQCARTVQRRRQQDAARVRGSRHGRVLLSRGVRRVLSAGHLSGVERVLFTFRYPSRMCQRGRYLPATVRHGVQPPRPGGRVRVFRRVVLSELDSGRSALIALMAHGPTRLIIEQGSQRPN
jgi:hypothetical protein